MTIEISKKEIFDEVEKRSSLEGSVLPERFDGVWASEDDGKFLESYWTEGCSAVVELLKRYLKGATLEHSLSKYDKDEVLVLRVEMPSRYNFAFDGVVMTEMKMMVACSILYRWLNVVLPEQAAKYNEESQGYAESLRRKILFRDKPNTGQVLRDKGCTDDMSLYDEDECMCAPKCDDVPMGQGWYDGVECECMGEILRVWK